MDDMNLIEGEATTRRRAILRSLGVLAVVPLVLTMVWVLAGVMAAGRPADLGDPVRLQSGSTPSSTSATAAVTAPTAAPTQTGAAVVPGAISAVSPAGTDDKGGLTKTAEPGDDKGGLTKAPEPGDDKGGLTKAPEPGDDKGGLNKTPAAASTPAPAPAPADDKGGSGSGSGSGSGGSGKGGGSDD